MRWSNDSHLAPTLLLLLHLSPPPPPPTVSRHCYRPCFLLLLFCLLCPVLLPAVGASVSVSASRDNGREGRRTPTTTTTTRTTRPEVVCGTTFTDTASSAVLADVVLEGRVRQKVSSVWGGGGDPVPGVRYNVSIQVRKQVWKGRELVNRGRRAKKLLLGTFLTPLPSSAPQDTAAVVLGDSGDRSVVADNIVAVAGVGGEEEEVVGGGGGGGGVVVGGSGCVADVKEGATYIFFLRDVGHRKGRYFEISAVPVKKNRRLSRIVSRILKPNAAKKPNIQRLKGPRTVKSGSSMTLRCRAKAKPDPVFTWYKDGVQITSQRGLRIKNSKRGSRLKISKTDRDTAGVFTCRAANALGEASKNITVKVTAPELIHIACQKQTYCFNGGTCRYIPDLHQTFCQCPKQWAGHRCEILDLFGPGNKDKTREAKLDFERVLIIVGIVIALLVFVVICIASYFLANRRRKRWEARRRLKQRQGPESDMLLDNTDGARLTHFAPSYRPLAQKETQTDLTFQPPAYPPPMPDLEAKPNHLHQPLSNSSGNILLLDNSHPPLLSAATVVTSPPPPSATTTATTITTTTTTTTSQKPDRPLSDMESRDVERNGVRSRLKAVSVKESCGERPTSWKGPGPVPDSRSLPVILDGQGGVPEVIEMNKLGPLTPGASSPRQTPSPDHMDGLSRTPTSPDSPRQSVLHSPADGAPPCYSPPQEGQPSLEPALLPPEDHDSLLLPRPQPRDPEGSGPGLADALESPLPVNGEVENWESEDEMPDTPLLPLHISEEDLNGNMPRLDHLVFKGSSSSPPPPPSPPPELFSTEPDSAPLFSLSPARHLPTCPPSHLPPVGPPLPGHRPGSLSEDDSACFLPHTLTSTEASSPLTEDPPQCETYAFDPSNDSDPDYFDEQFMHGSPKKGTGCFLGAEDKQDYERRLRNVCADQDAIPI
ncbi:uncharacterized protein LOC143276639 isoform X2 [Babylonia areolata]|uniref:uncharacterized protein LOC143276639 isoform X2 n=1 Tax=Babylonia areolata TaxID=304850 RepID=UPI003FD10DB8